MKKLLVLAVMCLSLIGGNAYAARDYIEIVGSSTVYPFSTTVAEQFGKTSKYPTPKVESTGSGGGLKLFCQGIGVQTPDMTNASRAIKQTEIEMCRGNGVTDILEVKIGYDGIVVANSKQSEVFGFTRKDLFLALAKEIPAGEGKMIPNPHKTWKDVNPALPAIKIEVLGPPPTSGTRDAFLELVMEKGAKKFDWLKALSKSDKKAFKAISHAIREDGAYIEAGENDNLIIQKLTANPNALGIFGFSFLDQNTDKIQGSLIEDVEPTFDSIADGTYSVSRPLFFYVKQQHMGTIPGMQEFLDEFTSDKAIGEDGYLPEKGLIPLPEGEEAIRKLQ